MSDRTQRLKGKANEVAGKAKGRVGAKRGKPETQNQGAGQALKGQAQQVAGHLRGAAKAAKK